MDDPAFGELVLVRHAQQGLNDLGDPSRPKAGDAPLSERGLAQAEATADVLAIEPVHHVYASDLRRARMTAAAIAARHGLEPIIDPLARSRRVRGSPRGRRSPRPSGLTHSRPSGRSSPALVRGRRSR
ncbi:MAG: histidine phosphatase family protein [Ilumatobacteraceae bacterium]